MLIRRETAFDVDEIDGVHRLAFAGATGPGAEPVEVGLVHALRADRGWVPSLSFVAEDPGGRVVGHVVATEGSIGTVPAVGLGPLGVLPEHQRRRVGHALMYTVLGAADSLDYPVVALLGHPGYYPRFGFVEASTLGIDAPDPAWGAHFQARPLAAHRADQRGTFHYAAPFERLGP
jgi:putative acetyltransferase